MSRQQLSRRLAPSLAVAAALLIPGAAAAADPVAPPAPIVDWQTHLAHMQAMPGPLGADVVACAERHGSVAGLLGPSGTMVMMLDERTR